MKKSLLFGLFAVVLLTTGCLKKETVVEEKKPVAEEKTTLANPASVNCQKQGGVLTIKTRGDGGQYGLCVFGDKACEEWALFRGACPVGGVAVDEEADDGAKLCLWSGGQVKDANCILSTGALCAVADFFEGRCDATSATKNYYIEVITPTKDQSLVSPLTIKGRARGSWYFEGQFNIVLKNTDGLELGQAVAKVDGEWTTENFVPFEAVLNFDAQDFVAGELIFQKSNPSGLPENDQAYKIPVKLEIKK